MYCISQGLKFYLTIIIIMISDMFIKTNRYEWLVHTCYKMNLLYTKERVDSFFSGSTARSFSDWVSLSLYKRIIMEI
jgi:hypothetical protein